LRPSSNAVRIDGVGDDDEYTGSSRTQLSPEAINDFQIVNHGFSAESGGGDGGSIDVQTRSGLNQSHGDAFVFIQNGALNGTPPLEFTPYKPDENRVRAGLAIGGAIFLLAYAATPPPDVRHRLSMASAYAGLIFLAASLWLGPWNVLRRRPNPISFDFRRDVGIWTGILAIVHTVIGLTVRLRGRMWMYFFKRLNPLKLQNTQFGFANFTGLAAALLFLMLLIISNDLSLRALKTNRWKSLQKWTYVAFVLTAAHGIAYQSIEKRHIPWVLVFAL
jgi:sulfoxide reductase heme-binding subunit YedZ